MNEKPKSEINEEIEVDLREPGIAALLAWLFPGAGHLYQRRYRKGALFMVCILGTFFFGLILGNGHVVYASWRPNDYRWQAVPQLGVGIIAFPAIVQNLKTRNGGEPYLVTGRRYPLGHPQEFELMPPEEYELFKGVSLADGFMAPPAGELYVNDPDVLAAWTAESQHGFELGSLYTVIAGLLNILAIYDAFAGPVLPSSQHSDGEGSGDGGEKGSGGQGRSRGRKDDEDPPPTNKARKKSKGKK